MKIRGKVAEPGMQSARRPVGAKGKALLPPGSRPRQPGDAPPRLSREELTDLKARGIRPEDLPVVDDPVAWDEAQPTFQEQMQAELAAEMKRTV